MKDIHLVFQLLNFLTSDEIEKYNLLLIDKWILTILAKHNGKEGIFPSQVTIAKKARIDLRYLERRLKYLKSIGLISTQRIKRSLNYYFNLPQEFTGLQTGDDNFNNSNTGLQTGSLPVSTPVSYRSTDRPKRVLNNITKERERKPLSLDFGFSEKHILLCRERKLDPSHVLAKFVAYAKCTGRESNDWESEAELWIRRELPTRTLDVEGVVKRVPTNNEPHSTVQEWGRGHPGWEALHGRKTN